jgi:uncharacterized protein YjiS (DUF1127 family)
MSSSSELLHYRHNHHGQARQHSLRNGLQRLWLTLNTWSQRANQRKQLLRLNEDQLKDIGISATEACHEGNKPFWKR